MFFRVKSCNNGFYKYYVVFLVKKDLDDKSMDLFINYYSSLRLIDQIIFFKVLEEGFKSQNKWFYFLNRMSDKGYVYDPNWEVSIEILFSVWIGETIKKTYFFRKIS